MPRPRIYTDDERRARARESAKRHYEKLVAGGWCTACPAEADAPHRKCRECRIGEADRTRRRYHERRRAAGRAPRKLKKSTTKNIWRRFGMPRPEET